MVVLEALACGAAVIASPRGGLRDAGGDAAVYIEPSDEQHLARTIAALANDPTELRKLQSRGTEHALANSWTARYQQLTEAVDAFAANSAPTVIGHA
jgi:glycosyltransferase involved in cell wall biosynthesis